MKCTIKSRVVSTLDEKRGLSGLQDVPGDARKVGKIQNTALAGLSNGVNGHAAGRGDVLNSEFDQPVTPGLAETAGCRNEHVPLSPAGEVHVNKIVDAGRFSCRYVGDAQMFIGEMANSVSLQRELSGKCAVRQCRVSKLNPRSAGRSMKTPAGTRMPTRDRHRQV